MGVGEGDGDGEGDGEGDACGCGSPVCGSTVWANGRSTNVSNRPANRDKHKTRSQFAGLKRCNAGLLERRPLYVKLCNRNDKVVVQTKPISSSRQLRVFALRQ